MSTTVEPKPGGNYVDFAEYVDFQLQKARQQIKSTDLLTAATVAAVAVLSYLLLFVICDQWLVAGGLPTSVRWIGLVVWLSALGAWLGVKLVWPMLKSVTGLFAAKELERSEPDLRSNLLNWVDLQDAGRPVDASVLRAIERQAAVQLSKIDVAQTVDHRPLLRAGYALLAVVILCCVYALASPKKISLARVLPFADVPVPTRTEIREVQPGDAHVLARSILEVKVELGGVVPPQVKLVYTTADLKFQDEPVTLQPDGETGTHYRGLLAGENNQGLLQDATYRIEAGDAVSRDYQITIDQPPSAKVTEVRVEPPAYTKLTAETIASGNFTGWEGSRVELQAVANMPLQSAALQFLDEPQGKPTGEEEAVTVKDGTRLSAHWTLQFRADGTYPRYFRMHCETSDGRRDPAPLVYQYTIRKDQPPEIVLIAPERDVTAPANAIIPLLAEARDPDFELGPVTLYLEQEGRSHPRETLFLGGTKSHRVQHDLALAPLDLKDGDEITFWLEAQDNRQPRRNRKQTPPSKIRIEPPTSQQKVQEQLAEEKQRQQELAEARTEQNADQQQSEPQQPGDEQIASTDQPQDKPEPSDTEPSEPMPDDKRANDDNRVADASPQRGSKGDQGDNRGQDAASPPNAEDRKLSPDGEDDHELLRKLHERLKEKQQRQDSTSEPSTSKPGEAEPSKQPPPESTQRGPGAEKPRPSTTDSTADKQASGTPKTKPQDASASDEPKPSPSEKSKPGEAPARNEQPKPGEKTDTATRSTEAPSKPGEEPTPTEKPQPGDKPDKLPSAADAQSGKKPMPSESPSPEEQPQPGATEPKSGDTPSAADQEKPGAKPANDSPKSADVQQTPAGKDDKATSEQKPGGKGEKPSAQQSPSKQPSGDKQAAGEGEKSSSNPLPGDRNKTGGPGSKPTDPNDGNKSGKADKGDPDAAPSPENAAEKSSQPGSQEKRDGQPSAKDEELQGSGRKDGQRSEQPDGGEAGGSKQAQDGNTGSKQRGPGESTARPGEQETGKAPSDENANKSSKPGEGGGQKAGGQPKSGGQQSTDEGKAGGDPKAGGQSKGGKEQPGGEGSDPKGANDPKGADGQKGAKKPGGDPKGAGEQESAKEQPGGGDQKGGKQEAGGGGEQPGGKPGGQQKSGNSKSGSKGGQPGGPTQGGPQGDGTGTFSGSTNPSNISSGGSDSDSDPAPPADAPNAEFNRQAAELVLQRLKEGLERGDIDAELLNDLGWTEDEMQRFVDRLGRGLDQTADDDTPQAQARKLQFEEMLKGLSLRRTGEKRTAGNQPGRQVDQIEGRSTKAPAEYRKAWEAYTKQLAKQKPAASPSK